MWHKKQRTKTGGVRRSLEDMKHNELEGKLDQEFSEYIRRRFSVNGLCVCVTCGRAGEWKELDAGHYISRVWRATRWDERNVRPQCPRCNRRLGGVQHVFRQQLVDEYGEEEIARMETRAKMMSEKKFDKAWLLDQIKHYRELNRGA